jgi:glucose-6-phosphate 1-dehydrogenase
LHSVFDEIDRTENVGGNYFFYLATAPEVFLPLVMHLAAEGLRDESDRALTPHHHRKAVRP